MKDKDSLKEMFNLAVDAERSKYERTYKGWNDFVKANLWDQSAWKTSWKLVREGFTAHLSNPKKLEKNLREIAESNKFILNTTRLNTDNVPDTKYFKWTDCMGAIRHGMVENRNADAKIYLWRAGQLDVCERLLADQPSTQIVCVSAADGEHPGGGYSRGRPGCEEELCRRLPTLHPSLQAAYQNGHYPFGPSTCSDAAVPEKYSDVLFTPSASLRRGGEVEGYNFILGDNSKSISVLSATPPSGPEKSGHVHCDRLLNATVVSMFIAPLLGHPSSSAIVLSDWGCGTFGNTRAKMAELFARALDQKLPGVETRLGRLYEEIHFAIPECSWPLDTSKEDYHNFTAILKSHKIAFEEKFI